MFNKKKQQAYLDALSSQEYVLMVSEHMLEQMSNNFSTPEHYDDLLANIKALYTDVHNYAKDNLPNYELYKTNFRKQDLEGTSETVNHEHDDEVK